MPTEQQQLEASLAALEAQRTLLGDAVVDAALGAIRARLYALQHTAGESSQSLKQVSILFVDVVGSTTLAQRLDPEEVSAVMDGALVRGTAVVEAHGGRALQYAGDNILAAFGANEASEDDTERCVRCGLALLDLGQTLSMEVLRCYGYTGFNFRVGIHTGDVLLGGGLDDDGSIRGQAVNIAARMEQTAPAGGLRISHHTYDQVRGLFEVSAPEPLSVKGLDQPIVSYLVVKAKPRSFRVARRGIEGVTTPMIGREAEFEILKAAFEHVVAFRELLAVSVVAEAGIGKSRLLDEFQVWTEHRPEQLHLFRGRATPRTQGQPFGLLRDIVAWHMQFSDDDTLDDAKSKMQAGLMPLFAEEPEFAEAHAHLLGHLIGLDWKESPHLRGILDDPTQIRNRAQHATAQMFRRVSAASRAPRGAPVILQLEDLHWADDETLDFLDYLAEVNCDVPLLLLAFTRPTLFERRAYWRSTKVPRERIDLHPLDGTASRILADELLKKLPEVPDALRDLITSGAEGNPYYMEELVRRLIDEGAIDASGDPWRVNRDRLLTTTVPSTLTGVLQARLDGLPPNERSTLQTASVIGQVFWDGALVALDTQTELTLPRLVERELAVPRHGGEVNGLREYAFRHAILHQVTYGTVLKRRRKALHAKVADWLAAQSESDNARAGDFLGLTAEHYTEAGDEANAAEFHARAAEHAVARLAHAAALAHVQQALALQDRIGDSPGQADLRWRLLHARERTLQIQGDREGQAKDLDAMEHVAQTLRDGARQAYVAHRRAIRAMRMAQYSMCEQFARRAASLADAELARRAHSSTPREADDALYELRLLSMRQVGLAMTDVGRWDDAQSLLQKTLEEARAHGLLKAQGLCLNSLAVLADRRGHRARGLELHRKSLDLWRQIGGRNVATALVNVGAKLLGLGDLVGARRDLEEGLQRTRHNGDRAVECAAACNLSNLSLLQGNPAGALALARGALDTAMATQARDLEVAASLALGSAEESFGRPDAAVKAYTHAYRVAAEIGASVVEASACLARLALAQGDIQGGLDAVRPVLSPTKSITQPNADGVANACEPAPDDGPAGNVDQGLPPELQLTVYRLLSASCDPEAAAWLQSAYRALMTEADAITDAALREMFLTNIPAHREIVSLWSSASAHVPGGR